MPDFVCRLELAAGLEKSFNDLDVHNAASLLLLDKSRLPQLVEFAKKRGWAINGDKIIFPARQVEIDNETIPTVMIDRALKYAVALEQIV